MLVMMKRQPSLDEASTDESRQLLAGVVIFGANRRPKRCARDVTRSQRPWEMGPGKGRPLSSSPRKA